MVEWRDHILRPILSLVHSRSNKLRVPYHQNGLLIELNLKMIQQKNKRNTSDGYVRNGWNLDLLKKKWNIEKTTT
jgi:hypothetical protein